MSPPALALASWDTAAAVLAAGLPSLERDAEGVRGGEWKVEAGGEGRGEGCAEPAGITGRLCDWPEGTC